MAKKKVSHQRIKVPQKKSRTSKSRLLWITGVIAVVAVVGIWVATDSGSKTTTSASAAPPEERKYIGRLLPANYEEPKIAGVQAYARTFKMTNVAVTQTGAEISLPADQVVKSKIVYFEYTKPGAESIPMVAYVKPSGKLFVGVSYCPPCQGRGQRIEPGGTLVCESCGTVRSLESGVGISGACRLYPLDELPASLSNGKITVRADAVNSWTPQPIDRPTNS